ncbi:GDSL esterase/lipase At5g45960-like [Lycium barbarum]|uniref:GDSL esterase/lipase At5g45960-like n=1 Tax=Lycium barbarum TaxID=112863 RepID=UPI00293F19C5|nr:GDSL esterase/lipase At5g45960-like [Lycium barbarum]
MHLSYSFIFLLLIIFMLEATITQAQGKSTLVSAIFAFGDSTADPGNNNYIKTPSRSNFSPYGRDFPNHVATGRFTNGMLIYDFIAKHVGVKESVPPYLDQSLSTEELKTGVSFASGGSGFDPLTPKISNVISISKQLENFEKYKEKMEAAIGKEQTQNLIKEALFIVSAGINDFVANYNTLPIRRINYTTSAYTDFLLQHVDRFLQELMDQGARKIAVANLLPMGCLPFVITLNSDIINAITKRDCIDSQSSIAQDYNFKLQNMLNDMQIRFAKLGSRIAYMDIYTPLVDMILGRKYDFEIVNRGCCGTGSVEFAFLCNPISFVCPNASKYVFWDSIHPTEKAYYLVSQALLPTIDSITKY